MWRREWLGSRDTDERGDTDDADSIDPDGDCSDSIDADGDCSDSIDPDRHRPDCHGVPNDNRRRRIPAGPHDDELWRHDNVRSESGRRRGRNGRVAERRIEQHAVGLDRLRDSRVGSPSRGDCLVVAETLRPRADEGAGAWARV